MNSGLPDESQSASALQEWLDAQGGWVPEEVWNVIWHDIWPDDEESQRGIRAYLTEADARYEAAKAAKIAAASAKSPAPFVPVDKKPHLQKRFQAPAMFHLLNTDKTEPLLSNPPVWQGPTNLKLVKVADRYLGPIWRNKSETRETKSSTHKLLWFVGLSIIIAWFGYAIGNDFVEHSKRFSKANRLAIGHVVHVTPGLRNDPRVGNGEPPSSHYQFRVDGATYEGWVEEELMEGETVRILYNSSNPNFNHAEADRTSWVDAVLGNLCLLFLASVFLIFLIRDKSPLGLLPGRD